MEAVPRMPMISFDLKHSPEYVEFGPTLKKYISNHYGEDPAHYNKSCTDLESLRQSAVHVSHDFMGCSTLKKYYAQLQFLQGRFPMVEGGDAAILFTWEEVHSGREMCMREIGYEQACILYNIGALHSVLGAMDTRQSADGMKVSCTHFQCALWAFEYVRDNFGVAGMSMDMGYEILTFQVQLMLSQAQECILEKSMTDSRKSTIIAKVASQLVEFYTLSAKHLYTCIELELISGKKYQEWKKKIDIKVLFYTCITNYYMGRQSEEQQKWGQCLAYYTLALDKLKECQKLAKKGPVDIQDTLKFTHDVVGGKHQSAKKDNDFVYHDKIPPADSLPEIKGACLVKGIPFDANDPEISGPDIFAKLVPMSAHEGASLYSEEKASVLRRIASEIHERNEELTQYLDSLQLDQTALNPKDERLPQQLLEKCAALSVRPTAIKDLVDSMTAVSNVSTDVEMGIQEIQQTLQEESKSELEFQETFGKRNPNAILSEIAQECFRLEEGHKKGNQSNQTLHKAMNTHINNLKLLSSPLEDLQNLLPSVDKDRDAESNDIVKQLNMLLAKIEEMRTQRESLEESLRKDMMDDDITAALCKEESVNKEALFAEQLKKHDYTTSNIRKNLDAQNTILRALTDANAKFATVRRATSEGLARREQTIRDLINSYDVYEDLKGKSQKGLEFYKKLETNVGRLLARCKNVCKVQQEEREKIYNKYKPKVAPVRAGGVKPGPSASTGNLPGNLPSNLPSNLPPLSGTDKLPPLSRVDPSGAGMGSVSDSDMPATGPAPVSAMFDGPKLKDYLPFMKPKTFGKKDGSPPITGVHPNVQDYLASQAGGSLPNSGTASPVHMPQTSGSVPASPDHVRHRFDGRLGPIDPRLPRQPGPDLTQGHRDQLYMYQPPNSASQGGVAPGQDPRDPRDHRGVSPQGQYLSQTDQRQTPSPNMSGYHQDMSHQGQNIPHATPENLSQYVPLDQKWKKEAKPVTPMTSYTPGGQGRDMGPPAVSQQPQQPQVLPQAPQYPAGNVPPQRPARHQQAYPVPSQAMPPPANQASHSQQPYGQQYDPQGQVNYPDQGLQQHPVAGQQYLPASSAGMAYQPASSQFSQQPMGSIPGGHQMTSGGQHMTSIPGGAMPPQTMAFVNQRDVTNTVSTAGGPVTSPGNDAQMVDPSQQFHGQPGAFQGQGHSSQTQQHQPRHEPYTQQPGTASGFGVASQHSGQQIQVMPQNQQSQPGQYMQQPALNNSGQHVAAQIPSQVGQHMPQTAQSGANQQMNQYVPSPVTSGTNMYQVPSQTGQYTPQPVPSGTNQQQYPITSSPYQQPNQNAHTQPYSAAQQTVPQIQGQGHIAGQGQMPTQGQQNVPQNVQGQRQGQQGYEQQQQTPQQNVLSKQSFINTPYSTTPSSQGQLPYSNQLPQQPSLQASSSQVNAPGHMAVNTMLPAGQVQGQPSHIQGQVVPNQQQNFVQSGLQQHHQQNQPQQQIQRSPQPVGSQGSVQPGQVQGQTSLPNVQPYQQQQQFQAPVSSLQNQMPTNQYPAYPGQQQHQVMPNQAVVQHPPQHSSPAHSIQGQGQIQAGPRFMGPTTGGQPLQGQQPVPGHQQNPATQANPGQYPLPNTQASHPVVNRQTIGTPQQPTQQQNVTAFQPGQGQFPQGHIQGQMPQPNKQMQGAVIPGSIQQRPPVPTYSETNMKRQIPPTMGQGQPQIVGGQNLSQGHLPGNQGQPLQSGQFNVQLPQQVPASQYPGITPGQGQFQGQIPQGQFQGQIPVGQGQIPTVQGQYNQVQAQQQSNFVQQNQVPAGTGPLLQPQILKPTPIPSQGSQADVTPAQPQQVVQPNQPAFQQTPEHGQTFPINQPQGAVIQPQASSMMNNTGSQPTGSTVSMVNQPVKPIRPSSPVEAKSASLPYKGQTQPVVQEPRIPLDRQLSTASSLDEILSSNPDGIAEPKENVLAPKVMTAQDLQQQKEDLLKNSSLHTQCKDPYKDKSKLNKFVGEVEKLAKFIEGFEKPSCSGPTPLDMIWKELQDEQEKAVREQKLAIARCYPMKNRDQDIMPYDNTRVLLTTLKDDYINASWVNDLSPACPKFIGTQAPLPVTLSDFWLMVCEQSIEVLVALSSDIEIGKKFPAYIPLEKGDSMEHGAVQLTVQTVKKKLLWTERILHLKHHETKTGRTLVHLHFNAWPVSGYPDKISHLLQFITEVHSFYRQQRSLMKPIVIHCSNGVGRTGMFQLIYVGMQEINQGHGIINIQEVAGKMLWKRRNLLLKQDQLKFCYEAILYYAQDVLAKEGILVHKASFGDELPKPGAKPQGWEPGEDILFGSMSFTSLQTNVDKLGTKKSETPEPVPKGETTLDEKLAMLKNEGNIDSPKPSNSKNVDTAIIENLEQKPKQSESHITAMLPDVVQNHGTIALERTVQSLMETTKNSDSDKAINVNISQSQNGNIHGDLDDLEKLKLSNKGSGSSSVSASPSHGSREPSSSPKPENLSTFAELQDPSTFTIGTNEGKKKKISKADFDAENRTVPEQDPNDPLSTLDPFWTVK